MRFSPAVLIYFLLLLISSNLGAQQLPEGFFNTRVASNINFPLGICFDKLGRMYVWEKSGVVWSYDTLGQRLPEPILDIRERVADYGEHGLNYFMLDKDFLENGKVFAYHALDLHWFYEYGTEDYDPNTTITTEATIGRLSYFIVDNPRADVPQANLASEHIVLGRTLDDGVPVLMTSHGLGSIQQAEDGSILLSNGDGASFLGTDIGSDSLESRITSALNHGIIEEHQDLGSYKSQYRSVLNGKILRIHPETGDGLPSNPFYKADAPRHPASRTWAYGLRNPYRIALKPLSGSHNLDDGNPGLIVVGDVGAAAWEEINLITEGGQNFGWPIFEGNHKNWAFNNARDLYSQEAPNPLYGTNGCNQAYFSFKQLTSNRNPNEVNYNRNPCDDSRIISEEDGFTFTTPPALFWNNRNYNPGDLAAVAVWNPEGYMDRLSISDENSPIEGDNFTGEASLGGIFYTSDSYPQMYRNAYFHVDYSGWIKVLLFDENDRLYKVIPFADNLQRPNHLALNPKNGNLYYPSLNDDRIYMISFGGNPPPVALAEQRQFFGGNQLTVNFDASSSYDPNNTELSYHWDFGDGSEGTGISPQHNFATSSANPTSFTVTLTVTDADGASDQTTLLVSLNNTPPDVEITSFEDGDLYPTYQTSLFDLSAVVTDEQSETEALNIEWQVYLHHDTHFHPEASSNDVNSNVLLTPAGCTHEGTYWYRIRLTATDPQGLSTITEKEIFPDCSPEPVNWITLSGRASTHNIMLNFSTLLTGEVASIEVQRSPDFFNFGTILTVTPNDEQSYTATDNSPITGVGYYRVKVKMQNGATHFSDPEPITFNAEAGHHLSPNPSDGQITVALYSPASLLGKITFFNVNGEQLFRSRFSLTPGRINQHQIDLSALPKGLYLYRIEDGENTHQGKLLLN